MKLHIQGDPKMGWVVILLKLIKGSRCMYNLFKNSFPDGNVSETPTCGPGRLLDLVWGNKPEYTWTLGRVFPGGLVHPENQLTYIF